MPTFKVISGALTTTVRMVDTQSQTGAVEVQRPTGKAAK